LLNPAHAAAGWADQCSVANEQTSVGMPLAAAGYFAYADPLDVGGDDRPAVAPIVLTAAAPRTVDDTSRSRAAAITVATVVAAWLWALLVASHLNVSDRVHRVSLFVHLAALVVGFGSVLVADLFGLLWITGRRPLSVMTSVIDVLHIPIWVGLEVLVVSGMLLKPDLSVGRVQIKMLLVLVAALNGLWATGLSKKLHGLTGERPPAGLFTQMMMAACISQCAWWGATLVGFLSTTS
jgi:hypothetical protein